MSSILLETEELFSEVTPAVKAQVPQWVVRELGHAFPGIESIPQVSGGEPCLVPTRIPVWLLVQARRLGAGEADLLCAYPALRAQDLANTWAYTRLSSGVSTMRKHKHGTPVLQRELSPARGQGAALILEYPLPSLSYWGKIESGRSHVGRSVGL